MSGWEKSIGLALLLAGFVAPASAATRVAVVDVGTTEKVPAAFFEPLVAGFTALPEIAVVERTDLRQILTEQACSLKMSDRIDSQCAVTVGRLCQADALLMLEASKTATDGLAVRIRLVDTRYGFKLWDCALPLAARPAERQTQQDWLAKTCAAKLANLGTVTGKIQVLGVTAFRSEEVSKRWDWLADTLAAGIEQQLSGLPGIVLAERSRTQFLTDERELTAGLPERLPATGVLVDGSYRLEHRPDGAILEVRVRCRRNQTTLLDKTIQGTPDDPGALCRQASRLVADSLSATASAPPMDPALETAMLMAEAGTYLAHQQPDRAFGPAQAAYALAPEATDAIGMLVQVHGAILWQDIVAHRKNGQLPDTAVVDELISHTQRGLELSEHLLRRDPAKALEPRYFDRWIGNILPATVSWLGDELTPAAAARRTATERAGTEEIRETFWRLYQAIFAQTSATGGNWNTRTLLLIRDSDAYRLCATPDEAIAFARQYVLAAAESFRVGHFFWLNWLEQFAAAYASRQPAGSPATQQLIRLLDEFTRNDDPLVRYQAERASMKLYADWPGRGQPELVDSPRARRHARTSVTLLTKDIWPKFRQTAESYRPQELPRFYTNAEDQATFLVGLFADLIEAAPRCPSFAHRGTQQHYVTYVNFVAAYDEQHGRVAEAAELLDRARSVVLAKSVEQDEVVAALRGLRRRHPELAGAEPVKTPCPLQRLVGTKDFPGASGRGSSWQFRRLVAAPAFRAIVCSRGVGTNEQYSVLWLDPTDLHALSASVCPTLTSFNPPIGNPLEKHHLTGPAVATDGRRVFLGLPAGGLMAFGLQDEPEAIDEELGLAVNSIWLLQFLDGKLYGLVGPLMDWGETGLMEIDLPSWKSRILFSSGSKDRPNELAGQKLLTMAADPGRHGLWLFTDGDKGWQWLLYQPSSGKLERQPDSEYAEGLAVITHDVEVHNRRTARDILVWGMGGAARFDLATKQWTPQYRVAGSMVKTSKWVHSFEAQPPHLAMLVADGLVCVYRNQFYHFREGASDPELPLESCGPSGSPTGWIHDLAPHPDGLLLLTESALYLLRGVKSTE